MNAVLLVALVLAFLRVLIGATVEPESLTWVDAYKDVAHVYMGYLLCLAVLDKSRRWWALFWGMCLLEVVVAVLSRL